MDRPEWAPSEIDLTKPSPARVYDAQLGGFHNFEVDRQLAAQANEMMPELPHVLRTNRSFLRRAVQFLVGEGVTQFLDLGSGIPSVGNVHEVAQQIDPSCRVAYVDIDPVAVAHSRIMLETNPASTVVQADLREPDTVLGNALVNQHLDLRRPVAVLMVAVLHFVSDDDQPTAIVRRYLDAVAPGSYLVISHAAPAEEHVQRAAELYGRRMDGFYQRTRAEIEALCCGLAPVEPGLVSMVDWRPDPHQPESPTVQQGFAVVAGPTS